MKGSPISVFSYCHWLGLVLTANYQSISRSLKYIFNPLVLRTPHTKINPFFRSLFGGLSDWYLLIIYYCTYFFYPGPFLVFFLLIFSSFLLVNTVQTFIAYLLKVFFIKKIKAVRKYESGPLLLYISSLFAYYGTGLLTEQLSLSVRSYYTWYPMGPICRMYDIITIRVFAMNSTVCVPLLRKSQSPFLEYGALWSPVRWFAG